MASSAAGSNAASTSSLCSSTSRPRPRRRAGGDEQVGRLDGEDRPDEERGEVAGEALLGRDQHDAEGEPAGEHHPGRGRRVEAAPAREADDHQHHDDAERGGAEEEADAEQRGDDHPGERGVGERHGEERQAAQHHVDPDRAAQRAGEHRLEQRPLHEVGAERLGQPAHGSAAPSASIGDVIAGRSAARADAAARRPPGDDRSQTLRAANATTNSDRDDEHDGGARGQAEVVVDRRPVADHHGIALLSLRKDDATPLSPPPAAADASPAPESSAESPSVAVQEPAPLPATAAAQPVAPPSVPPLRRLRQPALRKRGRPGGVGRPRICGKLQGVVRGRRQAFRLSRPPQNQSRKEQLRLARAKFDAALYDQALADLKAIVAENPSGPNAPAALY